MMGPTLGMRAVSILIIIVGVGWLMTAMGFAPSIDWVWTLGLAAVGVLTVVLSGGLDKLSVVVGPFLLAGSLLSIARQQKLLSIEVELPLLVILLGVLTLVAQSPAIRVPKWYVPLPPDDNARRAP